MPENILERKNLLLLFYHLLQMPANRQVIDTLVDLLRNVETFEFPEPVRVSPIYRRAERLVDAIVEGARPEPKPIPMLLFCPACNQQHIDAPEPESGWENPPHAKHKCKFCGWLWKPSPMLTTGVASFDNQRQLRDATPRAPKFAIQAGEVYIRTNGQKFFFDGFQWSEYTGAGLPGTVRSTEGILSGKTIKGQEITQPSFKSVLQNWAMSLPRMQQSVLIAAVRGPDGLRKDTPAKILCRYLRRSFMICAFEEVIHVDPLEPCTGSFTGPACSKEIENPDRALELYLKEVDSVPHHFQLHLMHAAEILGYTHPDPHTRAWWNMCYLALVNDMHLMPETAEQMQARLGDSESGWKQRENYIPPVFSFDFYKSETTLAELQDEIEKVRRGQGGHITDLEPHGKRGHAELYKEFPPAYPAPMPHEGINQGAQASSKKPDFVEYVMLNVPVGTTTEHYLQNSPKSLEAYYTDEGRHGFKARATPELSGFVAALRRNGYTCLLKDVYDKASAQE